MNKPAGFKTEASGTIWSKRYASLGAATRALEKLEAKGYSGAVNFLNGSYRVRLRVDSWMDNPRPTRRKNPTKAQKRAKAKRAAAKTKVASALATFLKRANPGAKLAGAKIQKLGGGVLKITPIKLNAGRRSPRNGYVVYQSGRGFMSLRDANAAAKRESKQYGSARVENIDSGKTVASWRNGSKA